MGDSAMGVSASDASTPSPPPRLPAGAGPLPLLAMAPLPCGEGGACCACAKAAGSGGCCEWLGCAAAAAAALGLHQVARLMQAPGRRSHRNRHGAAGSHCSARVEHCTNEGPFRDMPGVRQHVPTHPLCHDAAAHCMLSSQKRTRHWVAAPDHRAAAQTASC